MLSDYGIRKIRKIKQKIENKKSLCEINIALALK